MKILIPATLILLIALSMNAQTLKNYSILPTKSIPISDTIHGFVMTDNYRWLEDKDDPRVKEWSHAQHDYTVNLIKTQTHEIKGFREEIERYLDRDIVGAPFFKGKREFFYSKKKGEQQYKIYTRLEGKEIKIFDPEELDPSGKTSSTGFVLTKDGNKAAIGYQFKGDEISHYQIIDTKTGQKLGTSIDDLYGFAWTKDEKHAYITLRTKEMITKQLPLPTYLHTIGESHDKDVYLFAPKDAKDFASIWDDEDEDVSFYSEGDFYSNTLKIKRHGIDNDFVTIYSSKNFKADVNLKKGKLYFQTNDEAPNFKIMVADLAHPEFSNWKTFYPEKETVLEDFVITNDNVIVRYKKDVLARLFVYDLIGNPIRELELPEVANVSSMSYQKESNTVYVSMNTFTAPSKMYKIDGSKLNWEFFYQDKPSIETKDIESKMVFYNSNDGVKVPMFIVYRKGTQFDGNNPALLYGYGGFNVSMGPNYLGVTASFINRGGVYAIACLRGGDEYGENWHRNGMLFNKQNTFNDFISAAQFLIDNKYTNSNKLAIKGGSNGGLLIGATITQRPDLFRAAICAVPLLDMLRYHKFLIARYWIPEYGDPDKKEDFLNILKYSPYQNFKPGFNYPAMLVKAGENDSRVDPLHAKKFAAALQNNPGQKNPILLFIDFDSGHGSGQSVKQMTDNIELEWRFLMNEIGVK
ncbi:MAG: peptidase, family, catalytic domain protein [Ignavibacteria bacterium]|nr:peptidase, family, catalytic domain protein [Ignavibacteria bacterium]